jgi:LmbE family N-acetylglucosaminyl deacetylase
VLPDDEVERVLVVTAHPDDVDFGAAGSVARWVDAGAEVAYCIVTDGDAGGFDPDVPRGEIAGIRRAEQTAAAKEVGVERLWFLGHPDGYLEATLALRRDIVRVIRGFRPRRVVCQSPERNYARIFASHPDHLAAGEATMSAVYPDSRNPYWSPELIDEGLEAWTVDEMLVMAMPQPDTFVDVTDTVDRKIAALLRHESQMQNPAAMPDFIRGWLALNAATGGLGEGRLAEAFHYISAV